MIESSSTRIAASQHLQGSRQRNTQVCSLQEAAWRQRLAHLAATTGARFVRERIDEDPMRWLNRKLRLFGGSSALECGGDPKNFRRAMLLHELSLGLDADPDLFDFIPDFSEFDNETNFLDRPRSTWRKEAERQLFSATICVDVDAGQIQIFHAGIAFDQAQFERRVRIRYGNFFADHAKICTGFDWSEPLANALVSNAIGSVLEIVSADPHCPLAVGLDVEIQHRFET